MGAAEERRERLRSALATPQLDAGDDPGVRRVQLAAAVVGRPDEAGAVITEALDDPDAGVRRTAAELAGGSAGCAGRVARRLSSMLADDADALCREAAAYALGETGDPALAPVLEAAAGTEKAPVVRESIAAALGAIGAQPSVDVVLSMTRGEKPAVRRRALVALAAFDDPRIEPAWEAALGDRDRFVREAAEWLLRP